MEKDIVICPACSGDHASCGLCDDGTVTREIAELFNREFEAMYHEPDCKICGDMGRSYPTLQNPDGEICTCVNPHNKQNAGELLTPQQLKFGGAE